MNHASDTHQMKMGVFPRRVSLKLNSSAAKIFGWMLVTTDGKAVQRTNKWLWTQSENKTEANNSTLIRPSDLRPRDTVHSSEQVRCNSASHNWLALTTQETLYNCHMLDDISSKREKPKLLESCILYTKGFDLIFFGPPTSVFLARHG